MKKWIALLLVVAMCSLVLVGCKKDNQTNDDTGTPTDTIDPNRIPPEVKDFEGYTYIIRTNGWGDYMYAAPLELNGEGINDETYKRNKQVESLYNITIREDRIEDTTDASAHSFLSSQGITNDYFGDLFAWRARTMIGSLSTQGFFLNIHDLPELRLQEDWWASEMVNVSTINGRSYLLTGDIQTCDDLTTGCVFLNRNMFKDYYPDESIYDVVTKGQWTLDKFFGYWVGFGEDRGVSGKIDSDDIIGIGSGSSLTEHLILASGFHTFKMENNAPTMTLEDEKALNIVQRIQDTIYTDNRDFVEFGETVGGHVDMTYEEVRNHFASGKMLFLTMLISDALLCCLNMEDDVIYLPFPKYSTEQTNYYTVQQQYFTALAIAKDVPDPSKTALITEALAFYSINLENEVADVLLQERLTAELEARELFQITLDAKAFDLDHIGNIFGFESTVTNLTIANNLGNYSSEMKKLESAAINAKGTGKLQMFLEKYAGLSFRQKK